MRMRIFLLALSLITASVPSWASACAMAAALSPCQHDMSDMSDQMSPSDDCCANNQTDTQTKHGAPNGAGCTMAAVCAFTSGATPSYHILNNAFLASASVVIPRAEHFASADTSPPFRPPIA